MLDTSREMGFGYDGCVRLLRCTSQGNAAAYVNQNREFFNDAGDFFQHTTEELIDFSGIPDIGNAALEVYVGYQKGEIFSSVGDAGPKLAQNFLLKKFKTVKRTTKRIFGREHPTKPGYMGKQQPYDPETGRYLSPEANPGLVHSPFGRFTGGFSQGLAEGYSGVQGATPVGAAGRTGHFIGYIVGSAGSFF